MKFKNQLFVALALMLGVGISAPLVAESLSDTDKEKRWAEQIIDTLFDGDTVWLKAQGHEFLAIEMESFSSDTDRAAIVVHGIGIHPNWDSVIRPLRVGLTEHGWHTLSVQMPILLNEAQSHEYEPLLDEVAGRINAAIEYLSEQGLEDTVIVAHSMGSTMTMRYMDDVAEPAIRALVLIGMQGGPETVHDNAATLAHVTIPVLDLYGSEDLPGVVDFTDRKATAAASAGNENFQQIMVEGANHFFEGLDDTLVETVSAWLEDAMNSN